jgi:hypothetical protein
MLVDLLACRTRHIRDEVRQVGRGLEFDLAMRRLGRALALLREVEIEDTHLAGSCDNIGLCRFLKKLTRRRVPKVNSDRPLAGYAKRAERAATWGAAVASSRASEGGEVGAISDSSHSRE